MKFVKITLSNGAPITLPMEQAAALFASEQQLVLLRDKDGNWSGRTINKAFIVSTERDFGEEKTQRLATPALPEAENPISPEEAASVSKRKEEIRKSLGINKPYPDEV